MRLNQLAALKSPISVNFEATLVCNLCCGFCCSNSATSRHTNPSLTHVRSIIDALVAAEVFELKWFGGEFTALRGWQDAVEYAAQSGLFMSFVSNGTLLKPEDAKHMLRCSISGGAVSLHGPRELHDSVVNTRGAFDRAVQGIRYCIDAGIDISVLFTPTRENWQQLPALAQWLYDNRVPVQEINIGRLCPSGEAAPDWTEQSLSLAEYRSFFSTMHNIHEKLGIPVNMGEAFPICLLPKRDWSLVAGCWQGTGFGQISWNGDVKSCTLLSGTYGNLLETPLTEIWTNRLDQMRSARHLPWQCRICPYFCGGGCSASRVGTTHYGPDGLIPSPQEETLGTFVARLPGFASYLAEQRWFRSVDYLRSIGQKKRVIPMQSVPRIKYRHKIRKDLSGHLGFFEDIGLLTLNNQATAVVKLINGHRNVAEIVETYSRETKKASQDSTTGEVLDCLRQLDLSGVLAFEDNYPNPIGD